MRRAHQEAEAYLTLMEAHLFVDGKEPARFEWPDVGEVVLWSRRSPDKESANEDSALVAHVGEGRLVLAVADGLGGHAAGEQASRRAVHALRASLARMKEGDPLREAVLVGIDRANAAVQELGAGSGTTMATVMVEGGRLRAFHVGDSHVMCFGGRGKVKLETIPHSPVGFAVEAGFLAAEEALSHQDRHIVSNVVGDPEMHVGMSSPVPLCPRDSVVVASDGLFDNLGSAVVVDALRCGPLAPGVERLARDCTARMVDGGHPDDLTIIAFRPPARRPRRSPANE